MGDGNIMLREARFIDGMLWILLPIIIPTYIISWDALL